MEKNQSQSKVLQLENKTYELEREILELRRKLEDQERISKETDMAKTITIQNIENVE